MTQQHPITPLPELVQRLCDKAFLMGVDGALRGDVDVWLICEAYRAGYEQHERELLDAMHSVVPQPYELEVDEHGYPLKLGDFYAS